MEWKQGSKSKHGSKEVSKHGSKEVSNHGSMEARK